MKKMTKAQENALFGPEDHEGKIAKGKHTPGPWEAAGGSIIGPVREERDHHVIASVYHASTYHAAGVEGTANAAFIVRAVNCHEDLLDALKDLVGTGDMRDHGDHSMICRHCGRVYGGYLEVCPSDDCPGFKARAAIARAEGNAK